jgi:hypothetical protein
MKDDFLLKFKNFVKRIVKHAKPAVLFRIKNNKTCETGCFTKHEISRNGNAGNPTHNPNDNLHDNPHDNPHDNAYYKTIAM